MAVIVLRIAIIFRMAFFQSSSGDIDEAWMREAISGNLWLTMRMFLIVTLGMLLLGAPGTEKFF